MNNYPFFYNSVDGDRVYDANAFSDWLKRFFTTGVFNGEMIVSAAGGMNVNVSGGYANIEGKVQTFETTALTLSAAESSLYRRDTVVIERNDTDRDFYLKVIKGTPGGSAGEATATSPVRAGGIYQIVIAQILVAPGITSIHDADIVDTRGETNLCGYVTGTVKEIDFSEIEAQFQDWFTRVKDTLSEDAAGNLLQQIGDLDEDISDLSESLLQEIANTNDTVKVPLALGYGGFASFYTDPDKGKDFQRIPACKNTKVPDTGQMVIPANNTEYTKLYRLVFSAAICANYTADTAMIVTSVIGYRSNGTAIGSQGYYHRSPLAKDTKDYRYEYLTVELYITQAPGEGPITFYGSVWTYLMSYAKHVQLAYYPVGIVEN